MPNGAKNWCFTINNPVAKEKDGDDLIGYEYCILANEIGEDGTPHVQGYIAFKDKITMANVKKMMPRAHLEVMRGTPEQASEYCKKDGEYIECGTLPRNQQYNSMKLKKENFTKMIKAAKEDKFDDIMEIDPVAYVQNYHAFKRIKQDNPQKKQDLNDTCGIWLWGETGIGKSRKARADYEDIYDKPCNKWWDGYKGETSILIDDFDKNHKVLGHHLKRWGDRYSFPAEQKGTTVQIRPQRIIVTSNYSIEDIFYEDEALIGALKRRYKQTQMIQAFAPQIPLGNQALYDDISIHDEDEQELSLGEELSEIF